MNTKWVRAFILFVMVFAVSFGYQYVRRESVSISTWNKAFGYTAILLAAITLIIGPLASLYKGLKDWVTTRRQIGLLAFANAAAHGIISSFFIPDRFNLEWFFINWQPTILGLIALGIWIYLTYLSRDKKIKDLGFPAWKRYQKWGAWISFIVVATHIILLKFSDWQQWFGGKLKVTTYLKHPAYIPEALVVFLVLVVVVLYRIFFMGKKKLSK